MDQEELRRLIGESKGNERNICQIYAWKDGREETLFCRPGYRPEDAVHVTSVTKSVMALLTGIAIDQGYSHGRMGIVPVFFALRKRRIIPAVG